MVTDSQWYFPVGALKLVQATVIPAHQHRASQRLARRQAVHPGHRVNEALVFLVDELHGFVQVLGSMVLDVDIGGFHRLQLDFTFQDAPG